MQSYVPYSGTPQSAVGQPQSEVADLQQAEMFSWLLKKAESAVYILVLFYFSGVVTGIIFPPVDDLSAENPLARLLWFPIYGLALGLILINFIHFVRVSIFNPLLILCVLWCAISMVWSIDPALSVRRSVALLMTTLVGLAVAARYDWDGLVQRLGIVFLMMAIATVLMVLLRPSQGIMHEIHAGAWRGSFPEKNYLGGQMTKGVVVCMCAFAMRPKLFWLWIPAGLLCFFLVIMSTSKTALLISIFSIIAFLAIRVFRRYPILRLPVLYLIVATFVAFITTFIMIPDELFGLIGKDATFTGRTDIWAELTRAIKKKPILGYGYGTFWENPLGPSYHVREALQWGVPTAHNGWFETWLSSGVVGIGLFGLLYVISLVLAFDRTKRGGVEAYWAILAILMFAMFSMSESTILQQNDLSWVIFVATSAKLFAFERPFWRDRPRMPYAYGHHEDLMPQAPRRSGGRQADRR